MRVVRSVLSFSAALLALTTLSFAVQPDRIPGPIDSGQMVSLRGNVHGLARPDLDLGRADNSKLMSGVSLAFRPSAAQQSALNRLLAQQQDPTSPNYHKWLTPAQFADRFGMTQSDVNKVVSWLESQGFTVTRIANSRNQIFFQGTVAQIEAAFHTEIHDYLVDGEVHYANATEPSLPAVLAGTALGLQHLHNFQPRPRASIRLSAADPHFTSHISGSHFMTPGDFATIYDVQGLYAAGFDGTGQKIAVTGQSAISLTDVANYRSAAGLSAKAPTLTLMPGTGTSSFCSGDEGESDLDVEFTGGIAKNASITLVYAGLLAGDTCGNRSFGAFDALQYAVDNNVAPLISNSYGNCEANLGSSNALIIQGWAQQANTQGQTIISASGDSGAADCDYRVTSATLGFAVDVPAAIPEVTGAGGTEFNGDVAGTVTGTPPNSDAGSTTYWGATSNHTDNIASALSYIPEMGWNDSAFEVANGGTISASGGGKSTFFAKPTWQTGTGVPADGQRDVPDISVSSSAHHDGYLFCTSDGGVSCGNGFRTSTTDTSVAVVGGTSVAAPTLSGVMALLNQYFGNTPPNGLGSINKMLYQLAASNPNAFNDVTVGDNIVPCTQGSTNCPASPPFQYGFTAGVGYDQVTGLGSINAFTLAQAWAATLPNFTLAPSPPSLSAVAGHASNSTTITITPQNGFNGAVAFTCSGLPTGATCNFTPINATSSSLSVQTSPNMAPATTNVTVNGTSGNLKNNTTVALAVTTTDQSFTLAAAGGISVTQGNPGNTTITMTPANGFSAALTYTCVEPATLTESSCTVTPSGGTTTNPVTVNVTTRAPSAQLRPLLGHGNRIWYAALLPGLLGILFTAGSKRAPRALRLLSFTVVLGLSTLWMGACGGGSSNKPPPDPGTPKGSYTLTINATTGGASPVTGSTTVAMTVN